MKKKILIICIVIVVLVLAGILIYKKVNKDDEISELKTIQLNEVTRSVFYAPQYVAISNGFFEEEGIELEITTGQGAETPLPR